MISENSRYAKSILYRDGKDEFLGFRQRLDTSERPDDRFHKVQPRERIDLLAYRYLGDAKLWWVICDYNDIAFPLKLVTGDVLRIPSEEFVQIWHLG